MYSKDNSNTFNYYSSFANNYSNVSNNMGMMDFNNNHKFVLKPTVASAEYAPTVNNAADSMLLVHRRKMQRRAANRRSAQLSRARKKAHLEELKIENSRLQHMVDVLDSQPELVFCITSSGKITYVSERTINFIKINFSGKEESDDDPIHISQILSPESVDNVLQTIDDIVKMHNKQRFSPDYNMLFSAKIVHFQDVFGHPVEGYLRFAPVHRRLPAFPDEMMMQAMSEDYCCDGSVGSNSHGMDGPSAAKKSKTKNSSGDRTSSRSIHSDIRSMDMEQTDQSQWNLTNFNFLADCVSTLAHQEANLISGPCPPHQDIIDYSPPAVVRKVTREEEMMMMDPVAMSELVMRNNNNNSNNNPMLPSYPPADKTCEMMLQPESPFDVDTEFVCIIRTSDAYFTQFIPQSDLYVFSSSSKLSTASMEAHNLLRPATNNGHQDMKHHQRTGSSTNSGSTHQSSGSGIIPNSSTDNKNSTSSETGSDDNCNGSDENST